MQSRIEELTKNIIPVDKSYKYHVYALWDKGNIVYIGQSVRLANRITVHMADKDFDSMSYIECDSKIEMDYVEELLIIELDPKYNQTKTRGYQTLFDFRNRIRSINDYYKYSPEFYVRELRNKLAEIDIEVINHKGKDSIKISDVPKALKHILGDVSKWEIDGYE